MATATQDPMDRRAGIAARVSQFVDYAFGVLYVLLGMRFALALAGAHMTARFGRILTVITAPFVAPFRGILGAPEIAGGGHVVLSLLVALVVYLCLHLAVHQLLHVVAVPRRTV